jgi:hypothetical protein
MPGELGSKQTRIIGRVVMQTTPARLSIVGLIVSFRSRQRCLKKFVHIHRLAGACEIRRVLKPGGVVYSFIHLFTSDSGFHDLRVIAGMHESIPYWAHLRPQHRHEVKASSFLNEIRLKDWLTILNVELPGGEIAYIRDQDLSGELGRVRAAGELSDYSDDELLIRRILSAWCKPTE